MMGLLEHLRKMRILMLQQHAKALKKEFYIPLTGKIITQQATIDLQVLIKKFVADQNKILLLQGSAGTGKTLFCHHLVTQLLESKEYDNIIPLYISLKSEYNKHRNVIELILQEHGFSPEQIIELKLSQKFLFIFDHYERLGNFQNIYIFYQLEQWQAKVIVTYRPEYFINTNDYRSYFIPYQNKKPQQNLLQEVNIASLTDEQINAYLEHFSIQDTFHANVEKLSFLKLLARNPLFLKIIADILPKLSMQGMKDEKQADKNFLHSNMLNAILDGWFSHYEEKLKNSGLWDKNDNTLKQQLWGFSIALAQEVRRQKTIRIAYKPVSRLFPENQNPRVKFIGNASYKTNLLGVACLLIRIDIFQYEFIHADILNYLAAQKSLKKFSGRALENQITQVDRTLLTVAQKSIVLPDYLLNHHLNKKIFTNDNSILQFFADRVWESEVFKKGLFALVFASKHTKLMAIGAANAITILNLAGVYFSSMDLSEIHIPEANLSAAIFEGTLLQNADLSYVKLQGAWLRGADLTGSNMTGVKFGEQPFLELPTAIFTYCYSPSDHQLMAGGDDGIIYLYDIVAKKFKSYPKEHTGRLTSLAIDCGGSKLASASRDKTVCLWDLSTQKIEYRFKEEKMEEVNCVAFSPKGQKIASGGCDNNVWLWDVSKHKLEYIFSGHTLDVLSVAFNQNDSILVSGSLDGDIRLWNINDRVCEKIFSGHKLNVTCVAFSPTSASSFISSGDDKTLQLWDIKCDTPKCIFKGHADGIETVAFSPDGCQLISAGLDFTIHLWDIETGKLKQVFEGHKGPITCIGFSPDGYRIVSTSEDKTIRFWEAVNQEFLLRIERHRDSVNSIAISNDGLKFVSGSRDKTVRLGSLNSGKYEHTFEGHEDMGVTSVAFHPRGSFVASGGWDKTVRVWNLQDQKLEYYFIGHKSVVTGIAFSPDGNQLFSSSQDNTIRLWNIKDKKLEDTLQFDDSVDCIAFSPNGLWFAFGCRGLRLWDIKSRKLEHVFKGHKKRIVTVAFSPDGYKIASGSHDNTVCLWQVESRQLEFTFLGHKNWVMDVAFSPDGKKLASASQDNTVRLWDIDNRQCLLVMQDFVGSVNSVCWQSSSRGLFIVTGGDDKAVRCWQVIIDVNGKTQVKLYWTTYQASLMASGAHITGAKLETTNYMLLKQRGAVDTSTASAQLLIQQYQHHPVFPQPGSAAHPIKPVSNQQQAVAPQVKM